MSTHTHTHTQTYTYPNIPTNTHTHTHTHTNKFDTYTHTHTHTNKYNTHTHTIRDDDDVEALQSNFPEGEHPLEGVSNCRELSAPEGLKGKFR